MAAIKAALNDFADPRPPYSARYETDPRGGENIGTNLVGRSTVAVVIGGADYDLLRG